jgi:hypothetical protein
MSVSRGRCRGVTEEGPVTRATQMRGAACQGGSGDAVSCGSVG